MKNTEKKRVLNPKRLKIIAGILVIIAFSIFLDFVSPLSGSNYYGSDVKYYYDEKLEYIAKAVELYNDNKNSLPSLVLGGDSEGYLSVGDEIPDQLIGSGTINRYPEVDFNSIEIKHDLIKLKRDLIEFKMRHPMYNVLFGKNGDRVMNIRSIDTDILRELIKDEKNFPLVNQMYYERLENGESFQVFFVLPQMEDSEYKKFRTITSWTDLDYGWRGFSYSDTSELAIYGILGRYIDGKWQNQKFFLGGE